MGQLDCLEVFNARCIFVADNRAAHELAVSASLPMTAGSDAHTSWELGRAGVVMPAFDSPDGFLTGLSDARIKGRMSPFWIHFSSTFAKIARRLGWAPMPPT